MKTRTSILAFTLAAALSTLSCGPKDPPASSSSTGLDPGNRSTHFEAVSAHLDLGGEIYAYMDVDGDAQKLASLFNGFLDQIRKASAGDIPPQLAALDMEALASDLGLTGIGALGMSSYKKGELYHSNYYLHVPGGRTGLLKIAGGDAAPFSTRNLAPSGSDIIMEQDLDLKSAFELIGTLALKYGGPEVAAELAAATSQPIEGTGLTVAAIFGHLDTKISVVGQIHPDKPLDLPADVPVKIPGIDLLIALDNLGPVFAKLTSTIPQGQRGQLISEGDGFTDLTLPVPPDAAKLFQPVIRHETASGRVLFASSPAYLARCLAGDSSAWDDAAFQDAMEGLPETGNGLSFASAKFFKEYLRVYNSMFEAMSAQGGMAPGSGELFVGIMNAMGFSGDHSQARVITNLPDGILVVENTTVSAKQNIVAAGVTAVAVVAGVMVPVTTRIQQQSMPATMPAGSLDPHDHSFDAPPSDADPSFDNRIPGFTPAETAPPEPPVVPDDAPGVPDDAPGDLPEPLSPDPGEIGPDQ